MCQSSQKLTNLKNKSQLKFNVINYIRGLKYPYKGLLSENLLLLALELGCLNCQKEY
jgi:hypothetical protein